MSNWYAVAWLLLAACCGSNWSLIVYVVSQYNTLEKFIRLSLKFFFCFYLFVQFQFESLSMWNSKNFIDKGKNMYMYTAYVLIKPILWANYCLIAAEEWEATMNDRMETKEKKKLYIINFDFIKKIYVFLIWKPEQCELIAFYLLVSLFVPICFSSSYS